MGRINANITAKLLGSQSLTLSSSRKLIWPVYLCDTFGAMPVSVYKDLGVIALGCQFKSR